MAVSAATRVFALDLFEDLGDVSARDMMGGLAIYAAGRVFALVGPEDRICLKATGAFADALAAAGAEPFVYVKSGKPQRLAYWSLPEAALDDPVEACAWARRALAAANPGFP